MTKTSSRGIVIEAVNRLHAAQNGQQGDEQTLVNSSSTTGLDIPLNMAIS